MSYPTSPPPTLSSPPPPTSSTLISFPTPEILLVTINRPDKLNSIDTAGHWEMHRVWEWYDSEPTLRCAIVTGAQGGKKPAFCAGQDLKEWHASVTSPNSSSSSSSSSPSHPPSGFAGLSQRTGKKPVISAIHGLTFGGGFETLLNTDLSLCTPSSTFSLPEASLGLAAFAGALPRLTLLVGLPRASEIALAGRVLTAAEAEQWGVVNRVVGEGEDVVGKAVEMAQRVLRGSPEAVVVTREGLRSAWYLGAGIEEAVRGVWDGVGGRLREGENVKVGLAAFLGRKVPRWGRSKL